MVKCLYSMHEVLGSVSHTAKALGSDLIIHQRVKRNNPSPPPPKTKQEVTVKLSFIYLLLLLGVMVSEFEFNNLLFSCGRYL